MTSYSWVSFSHERQSIKIPTPQKPQSRTLETVLGAILRRKYFRNFLRFDKDFTLGLWVAQKLKIRVSRPRTHWHTYTYSSRLTHLGAPKVVLFRQVQQSHHGHAINSRRLGGSTLFRLYLLDENFLDFAILLPFLHLLLLPLTWVVWFRACSLSSACGSMGR